MSGEEQVTDLFNNPAMKKQFESLPPSEKEAYRKAGEYMYEKDYTADRSAVDDAVAYIRTAFQAGMMPTQLTDDELVFLRNVYGPEWFKEFGFDSETHSGLEKKTTSKKQRKRPEPIKMPVLVPRKCTTTSLTSDVDSEDEPESTERAVTSAIPVNREYIPMNREHAEDPENLEINRQTSYVYTVWC